MSQRKYLRRKAHHAMEVAGIEKLNKPRTVINPRTGMIETIPSKFAENWRKYI